MPTYDYQCNKCKAVYELRQGFDAETTHTCEECGKGIAKRILATPAVVFKGSGWYATDSRGKSSSTSTSTHTDESGKAETKTEAAPSTDSPAASAADAAS